MESCWLQLKLFESLSLGTTKTRTRTCTRTHSTFWNSAFFQKLLKYSCNTIIDDISVCSLLLNEIGYGNMQVVWCPAVMLFTVHAKQLDHFCWLSMLMHVTFILIYVDRICTWILPECMYEVTLGEYVVFPS